MKPICIQKYIKGQKNCSFLQNGLRLNNNASFVNFQFELGALKYIIEVLSLRGADHSVVINGTPFLLKPNNPTFIDVHSNVVQVCRSNKARGHIIISNVFFDDLSTQNDLNDTNLFRQIVKLGKLKGIKQNNLGVFACEFAEFGNEKLVLGLETDPHDAWIRKNGKIIFIRPCRIFYVKLEEEQTVIKEPKEEPKEELNFKISTSNIPYFDDIDSELWFKRLFDVGYVPKLKNKIAFCKVETKPMCDVVFVNEFSTNSNLDNLNCTKTIITPSLINYILLKNKFPNKEIRICGRLLPIINYNDVIRGNGILLFNKDSNKTMKIVEQWDDFIGELCVIGYNTNKSGVMSIMDNLSLEELLHLISNSFLILDNGICSNYMSSILELAIGTNSLFLTNNSKYIMHENCYFIKGNNIIKEIINLKNKPLKIFKNKDEEYKKKFIENINLLFGDVK